MFEKLKKDRKSQIVAVIIAVLLLASGYLLFAGKSAPEPEDEDIETNIIEKLTAEELGLTMEAKPDGKAVKFIIENTEGIETIEYSLSYEADSTSQEIAEGGDPRVGRGIIGESEIDNDTEPFESEWLDLGSCSKNVCRYDSGVESVELTLKIEKSDGKIYSAEASLEL